MTPEVVDLGQGAKGYFAKDADGRVLWSVRFPAHACYSTTNDPTTAQSWHCEVGEKFEAREAPQSFRHGKAENEEEARRAIDRAYRLGRPTRENSDGQFVRA